MKPLYYLATLLMAPILLAEGLWVRLVTPRLPEPAGPRSGIYGEGPPLRLLIAGDSAAAGVGVDAQQQALSGQLVSALGTTHAVAWKLLAQTGDDAGDVLSRLRSAPAEPFDVVLVSVGVNDVTAMTGSKRWLANLQSIVEVLQSRFHARHVFLSGVPPMHLFPALPQPLRWWMGARARHLNTLMGQVAARNENCTSVSVPFPFERHYMAQDGFHPGGPAYELWGKQVAAVIRDAFSAKV